MEGSMNHKTYHRSKTVTVFFLCVLLTQEEIWEKEHKG